MVFFTKFQKKSWQHLLPPLKYGTILSAMFRSVLQLYWFCCTSSCYRDIPYFLTLYKIFIYTYTSTLTSTQKQYMSIVKYMKKFTFLYNFFFQSAFILKLLHFFLKTQQCSNGPFFLYTVVPFISAGFERKFEQKCT